MSETISGIIRMRIIFLRAVAVTSNTTKPRMKSSRKKATKNNNNALNTHTQKNVKIERKNTSNSDPKQEKNLIAFNSIPHTLTHKFTHSFTEPSHAICITIPN